MSLFFNGAGTNAAESGFQQAQRSGIRRASLNVHCHLPSEFARTMNTSPPRLGLPELINEHEDLALRLKAERMWWQQLREMGKPNFGQMAVRLDAFRKRLAQHFEHEETAEHSALRAEAAWADHATQHHHFLDRLDAVIRRLNGCGPGYDCWGAAGQEFEIFAAELLIDQETELQRLRDLLTSH